MATLKLTYFNGRGLAEPIRLLLAESNTQYEEEHVGTYNPQQQPEGFTKLKNEGALAFDALPLLTDTENKVQLVQSHAILRHVARLTKRYGNSLKDEALIDQYHEGLRDFHQALSGAFRGDQSPKKEKALETIRGEIIPKWFKLFERILMRLNGGSFLLGNTFSYVDILLFYVTEYIHDQGVMEVTAENYPLIHRHYQAVSSRPHLKEYITSSTRYPIQRLIQ